MINCQKRSYHFNGYDYTSYEYFDGGYVDERGWRHYRVQEKPMILDFTQ